MDSWRYHRLTQKVPGATAKQRWLKRMQKRELSLLTSLCCFPQGRLIPVWAWWLTFLHDKKKTKNPEHYATHLTQHRLNCQLAGRSPLWNTCRVTRKETLLCLPYAATPYCFKKKPQHSVVQINMIQPEISAVSTLYWLLTHTAHQPTMVAKPGNGSSELTKKVLCNFLQTC